MQAWIVKHEHVDGVYMLAEQGGRLIAHERPQTFWSKGLAQLAVSLSKRPEEWRVKEVEITEK